MEKTALPPIIQEDPPRDRMSLKSIAHTLRIDFHVSNFISLLNFYILTSMYILYVLRCSYSIYMYVMFMKYWIQRNDLGLKRSKDCVLLMSCLEISPLKD